MKKIIASALLVMSFSVGFSQNFEGTINFGIEYVDLPDEMAAMESMLPKEMSYKFKDDMAKMIQPSAMGQTVVIHDSKAKETTILMDIMGSKYAMKSEDSKKEESNIKPEIILLDETKTIAGYKCKKAEVTVTGEDGETQKLTIFYTEDLTAVKFGQANFEGIPGFPLEYEMEQNGMIMKLSAKEVVKEKISKAEFVIPKDYQEITQDELKAMFGGK